VIIRRSLDHQHAEIAVLFEISVDGDLDRLITMLHDDSSRAGKPHLITLDVRDGRIHRLYDVSIPQKITASAASDRTRC
jgi:hypothetical protein